MEKTADYTNTEKYSNNKSFDGKAVEAGKVLVPFLKDKFHLRSGEYMDENFTTMYLGDFKYPIGYMAIKEDKYADYMQDFGDEVNKDMETINRLTDILVTMNTPADRGKLFKILKMLYGLMDLPFSEEAEPMDADPTVLECL